MAVLFDAACWLVSYAVFAWLRFDTASAWVPWTEVMVVAAGTTLAYFVLGAPFHLHRGRSRMASLDEMVVLGPAMLAAGGLATGLNLVFQWVPQIDPGRRHRLRAGAGRLGSGCVAAGP